MRRSASFLAAALAAVLLAGCPSSSDDCRSPSFRCGDRCVDGSRDPSNCGGCGVACGAGQACCGTCVDLQTSPFHCGACDARCPVGGLCTAGACGCPPALPDPCGASPGACVNLQTGDGGYCGQCGFVCAAAGVAASDAPCVTGACVCAGTPAATACGNGGTGFCVNTLVDPSHCGGCGSPCPPRATCSGGTCGCGSSAYPHDCGATVGCVNLGSDPAHCGGCATACSGATPSCSSGRCCAVGRTNCSGICVDTQTSDANCGACGNACSADRSCSAGACACGAARPQTCGTGCCAGTGCCGGGGTCQTAHGNGLGQAFFDCVASYTASTTTRDAAVLAAQAWGAAAVSDATFCGPSCLAAQKPGRCAVWCYGDSPWPGQVRESDTVPCGGFSCPGPLSPAWPTAVP